MSAQLLVDTCETLTRTPRGYKALLTHSSTFTFALSIGCCSNRGKTLYVQDALMHGHFEESPVVTKQGRSKGGFTSYIEVERKSSL